MLPKTLPQGDVSQLLCLFAHTCCFYQEWEIRNQSLLSVLNELSRLEANNAEQLR